MGIGNNGEAVRLGPLSSPAGDVVVTVEAGTLTLSARDSMLFSTDHRGRISQIVVERGLLSVRFPEGCPGSASFRLGPAMAVRLVSARLDGHEIATVLDDGCRVMDLSGAGAGARLDFHLTPAP